MAGKRRYFTRFHAQHRAWASIKRSVDSGALVDPKKLKCMDCRGKASEYDHYLGYADQHIFAVQPVCKSCHMKREYQRGATNQRLSGAIGPVTKDGHFMSSNARLGKDTNNRLSRIRIGPRTKDGRFITAHGRYRSC